MTPNRSVARWTVLVADSRFARVAVASSTRLAVGISMEWFARAGVGRLLSLLERSTGLEERAAGFEPRERLASLGVLYFKSFADMIRSSRPFVAKSWALQDLNPRQLGPKPSTLSRLS